MHRTSNICILLFLHIAILVEGATFIRVNTFGFQPTDQKLAVALSSTMLATGTNFTLVNTANNAVVLTTPVMTSTGRWSNSFPNTYHLFFTTVQTPGKLVMNFDV
jgi:accessory gene regulator protein AgrB